VLAAAERQGLGGPPPTRRIRNIQMATITPSGMIQPKSRSFQKVVSIGRRTRRGAAPARRPAAARPPRDARHREDADLLLRAEQLAQACPGDGGGHRQGARLGHSAHFPLGQGDALHLVGAEQLEELGHRDLDGARGEQPGLQEGQKQHHDQGVGQ
jgi:hypothetical protein